MHDSKLHGSLIKKLSISVAELSMILVRLLIIGRSDSEYIVSDIKITAQQIINLTLINSRENILNPFNKNNRIS